MSFPLVLFDIDGTLTEPRQVVKSNVINALLELVKYVEIGFLTGSDLEYVKEQLWPLFERTSIKENCHVLPCNGTQYYIPGEGKGNFNAVFRTDMKSSLGDTEFNRIMRVIITLQAELVNEFKDIPLTGHFIQNRGSMINWCPIGRNASNEEREDFTALDNFNSIRKKYLNKFRKEMIDLKFDDIEAKLGGSTSFDIYPYGWDKTFALKHFSDNTQVWFLGDRCSPDGNDFEIFNLLQREGRSYEVASPDDTVEIIEMLIAQEFHKYV